MAKRPHLPIAAPDGVLAGAYAGKDHMKELSNDAESVALARLLEAARVSENEDQLKIKGM